MVSVKDVTKFTAPDLPQVLQRPRLTEYLGKAQDKKLILILGQAAQGKTTLAASVAAGSTKPCAWINLTEDESEAANLFYVLVYALDYALKEIDVTSLLSYPSLSTIPRKQKELYRDWAGAIFESLPVPVTIFLDGLDQLSPKAPSMGLVQALIDGTPAGVQIVLLSREMPPLEILGLRIRGQATILTNEDLAFSLEEMTAFFRRIRRIPLSTHALQRIYLATEGWIGGLILLSDNLERFSDAEREEHVAKGIPERVKKEIFGYFAEEIFGRLPARAQELLLKASVLSVIEPPFLQGLVGIPNPSDSLRDLAMKNMFVHAAYTHGKGWLFRYHQLFREFLLAKLASEMAQEDRKNLQICAAALYEGRGRAEEALRHYLMAGAHEQAAGVLEKIGMDLWKEGRSGALSRWLNAVPTDFAKENPWLILYRCLTQRYTGARENAEDLQRAFRLFGEQNQVRGSLLSLAYLIEAAIVGGNDIVSLHSLMEKGEAILKSMESDEYPNERSILWFYIGFGRTLRGDARKGLWACQNALLLAKQTADLFLEVNAMIYMLEAHAFLGEFESGEAICRELVAMLDKTAWPELRLVYLINGSTLRIFQGNWETASELLEEAGQEVQRYGLVYLYPVILLHELMLQPCLGQFEKAEEIGNRLLDSVSAIGNQFQQGIGYLFLGLNAYRKGAYEEAKHRLARARAIFSSDAARSERHLAAVTVLEALVSYHLGGVFREADLKNCLGHAEESSNYLFLANIHLAMALVKHRRGSKELAASHLAEGFRVAQERGEDLFWFMDRRDLLKACLLAFTLKVEDAMEAAETILTGPLASNAREAVKGLLKHADSNVRARAQEMYRIMRRAEVPSLRIRTLGGFRVYRDDRAIPEKDWIGGQSKILLKAIVAHGQKGIARDELMEVLYEDSGSENVRGSFKVALHRLRKSVEPTMDKVLGSSYVHLNDNLVTLDPELCETDVNRFFVLAEEARAAEEAGDLKGAEEFCNQAIGLFGGDFLEGEGHLRWADEIRRKLDETHREILMKRAGIHEIRGAVKKAITAYENAIEADPVHEEAYRRLMTIYMDTGRRNEALKVFKKCERALAEKLDTRPDEVTYAIYRKITER